jgi:hexokinase
MISSTSSCNLMDHNIEWLKQHVEQYQSEKNDVCEDVEDFSEIEKLGQGFTLADPLEEVDIGNGAVPRPTFEKKIEYDHVDCFTWSYSEMLALSHELVEH